jgi:hypothetical protein
MESMSDQLSSRPIFGRIVVRVALAEPEAAVGQPVFQRAYAAEEPLQTVTLDAWSWYRPAIDGHGEPALYHGATRVASIGGVKMAVGDLLALPDQHTLGTVQLALRCS